LTVYDEGGTLVPRLAQKVPTIEDGDWTLAADGQMEITWRLRPGIRWHDGTPLSIEDFVLGLKVVQDNEVPINRSSWVSFVSEIRPVSNDTFVMVWRQPYMLATASGPSDLPALPAHILGSSYESGDKQAFSNSPYWAQEFMGLGPYKMKDWVLGSHLTAVASDDYFLGRPRIDELVFRFFTDVPPLMAALLAGELDIVPVGAMKADEAMTVKQSWEQTGAGTAIISLNGLRVLYFQYRDTNAPWVRDVRVRRALTHMQDRQTLVETLKSGLTTIGHTVPTPQDPLYRQIEQRGLPKYDYDLRKAQELLAEAGWNKGANGIYQNAAGQPLSVEIRTVVVAPEALQEILAEADQFIKAGVESPIFQVRQNDANRSELRAKAEGVFSNRLDDTPDALSRFHSSLIASEANRWLGQNVWGYSNPVFDRMYDRYIVTMEVGKRQDALADMLKMHADEVTYIPMWYELGLLNMAFRKGVRGPVAASPIQQENMWNVHLWEKD
jgi:peptide/nickel transport system substrate-binding protein